MILTKWFTIFKFIISYVNWLDFQPLVKMGDIPFWEVMSISC